jgi:rubrerythrin
MTDFKGQKTHQHLKEAFYRESETVLRYLYFAKTADIEGFPEIAQIFRKFAEGGEGNAHGNLDFLKTVGDPQTDLPMGEASQNLESAIHSETRAYIETYPMMAAIARQEQFFDIASWFETLAKLKKAHVAQLNKTLKQLKETSAKIIE